MIKQIAANTGQSDQMLRATNRGRYVPPATAIADNRPDSIYQMAGTHIYDQEMSNSKCKD